MPGVDASSSFFLVYMLRIDGLFYMTYFILFFVKKKVTRFFTLENNRYMYGDIIYAQLRVAVFFYEELSSVIHFSWKLPAGGEQFRG